MLGSPFFIGVTNDGGVQQQESAATQQDRDKADVFPGSISGETRFFPEGFESVDRGGSGCSESIPETLAADEQKWMSVAGRQTFDTANVMSYEEFVRMQQECDSGSESSMEESEDRMVANVSVELSEMD